MWKTLWRKNHTSFRVPLYTSSPGRKQTWFSVVHSVQVFEYCWYFLIMFPSRNCLYIKQSFFIKRWNVFWWCSCGNRYSLEVWKETYWELTEVGWRISQGKSQKCSDQNTKVVRFYLCAVTIPYLSEANDRIEIDNFCCLMSCSKRLYKWKSWSLGDGSNSSSIVLPII